MCRAYSWASWRGRALRRVVRRSGRASITECEAAAAQLGRVRPPSASAILSVAVLLSSETCGRVGFRREHLLAGVVLAGRRGAASPRASEHRVVQPDDAAETRAKCEITKSLLPCRAEREGTASPVDRSALSAPLEVTSVAVCGPCGFNVQSRPGHVSRTSGIFIQDASFSRPGMLCSECPGVCHGVVKLWSGHCGPGQGARTTRLVT